jgi:hypothetical protein
MSAKNPVRDLHVAGEPRVQLLPPSVRLQEKARETRRMLVLLVLLALSVVAAGLTLGFFRQAQTAADLASAQERTAQILADQQQYAEASQLSGLVTTTEAAQKLLTAGEVDWAAVVGALRAYLPEGAVFQGAELVAPAPWEPALVPEGPLRASRVATVMLTLRSDDYSQAAAFVAAVQKAESVADVRIVSSAQDAGQYVTTVAITLNDSVLTTRFDDTDDADSAEGSDGGDAASDNGGTESESPDPGSSPSPSPSPEPAGGIQR